LHRTGQAVSGAPRRRWVSERCPYRALRFPARVFFAPVLRPLVFFDAALFDAVFLAAVFLDAAVFFDAVFFDAVFFDAVFFDAVFFDAVFFDAVFFDAVFFAGTFAPALRAFDKPIAIACLRLLTVLPEPPLLSFPRLRSAIAVSTSSDAFLPYFAIGLPPSFRCTATTGGPFAKDVPP
jgi:hypothetical protein